MSKPEIVLLHGALGAKSQFAPLLPLLAETFTVHALDFAGHGAAGIAAERPLRLPHFAADLIAYLDEQGMAQAHVFGHSMGGYVGLLAAREYPDRIGRVFTLGTKFAWTPEFAAREVKLLDAEKMLAKVPAFVQQLQERHTAVSWRDLLAKTAEMMRDLGENPPLTPESAAHIPHAVRIGLGDRDHMVTLEESAAIYRALPNGQLHVLPDTPHPLEKVNMADLAAAIIHFFA